MTITIRELAEVVGAKNDWQNWGNLTIDSVEFDTRKVTEGSLFVPLQGGARDGHEFINVAADNGAVLSLWAANQGIEKQVIPTLVVEDTLVAMQEIAKFYLRKIGPKVIGITGSNGKTTTKDMVDGVLSQAFKTYKTQGNFNNQIGLPYTILSMPADTEMLVLEMGMNGFNEIEELSLIGEPDVAAITMIGESHLEFLGTRKGIAQAKMEITAGLKKEGLLVVPSDEPLLESFLEETSQEIKTFGFDEASDVKGQITEETRTSTSFTVNLTGDQVLTIPVLGSYNVKNALIAATIGNYFGISSDKIAKGLMMMNLTQSRTEWLTAANGAEILSDVYNANPTAMSLVLQAFEELPCEGEKLVVLADMGELGDTAKELHESIAEFIPQDKIAHVYLYGTQMEALADKLKEEFPERRLHHYALDEKEKLAKAVKKQLKSEDMVVLKGSNSMKLIEIVEKLVEN
ncbi:UDP-N-acetylmuramoyl-tripeptide--D-alanyl-D-alanine ligase [Vagococcus sp. PNs007]|uniref:UDP-N-acetylmuramoyl-tripeptide--D-alanyl-D-alanine ligase n=1 Tax=Vagococcus proximus TaxID=2991417 RepID=A0ABT5X3L3_9ENTE|nr:UDP-N-acetylmuramoyl-tripeptide--D-alanyl-D-alanine ligase [Vagococcus proximus]MDF0480570.1 UDP-N-acetylmuramoyl-tripeptide--D-alanyl-D-alanine ligase [Vagococcus proximus]